MKKSLIYLGLGLIVLGLVGFFVFGKVFNKPGKGALQIATTPAADVFLDGEKVGSAPYFNDELEAGEYVLRLVPQDEEAGLITWEKTVKLVANIVTAVNYQLAASEESSSGEILSLEKFGDAQTSSLTVVTQPDGALVKIDGESKGFAPIAEEGLIAAEHEVVVSSPGFVEKRVTPQTIAGYKLTLFIKLAQQDMEGVAEATESAEEEETEEEEEVEETEEEGEVEEEAETTPSPIDLAKPYVKIKSTPTGWLRVRLGPSTTATEAAKVKPDEVFPYLEEEENGWYKIEYESDEEGWVSGVYADLVE